MAAVRKKISLTIQHPEQNGIALWVVVVVLALRIHLQTLASNLLQVVSTFNNLSKSRMILWRAGPCTRCKLLAPPPSGHDNSGPKDEITAIHVESCQCGILCWSKMQPAAVWM
eukprot:TRINITY_DN102916_c0_g1_i1.p1 TRINITY_DN102916_c0_g1~~TRINITY_DN102916_c0_g1_i1.p1  ORF type:complete len:123 (+),score=13.75 TRINITY_DN102916_c0_g1_i1:33-371(+)